MAGNFKKWPYPKQCPVCSGAWYDKSYGDTPYVCQLLGQDGKRVAFGNPNAPMVCGDYRKGKMNVAEGMNANIGYKSKAKSDGGKVFEGAGQILRNVSNSRSLSADELVGGSLKIVGGLGGMAIKGIANASRKAEEEAEAAEAARKEEAILFVQNSWETLSDVTFSDKNQTIKEIDNLFEIFSEVYSPSNENVGIEDRGMIADACLLKLEEGIGLFRGARDSDVRKADEFQIKLQKCKINRLKIKDHSSSEGAKAVFYNKNMTILNSVSLDGGTKLVTKSIDLLLSIKNSLFSFMYFIPVKSSFFSSVTKFPLNIGLFSFLSGANGIASDQKRALCDSAIEKIEQGINLYKNDPNRDEGKLAKFEAGLEEFRIYRNGITFTIGQNYNAEIVKNILNNISLDGGSAFVEAGMDAVLSVKNALFGKFGSGKKIPWADKKEISGSAIEKMEIGITALKKDPIFNAKKLAKYEKELADFKDAAQRA